MFFSLPNFLKQRVFSPSQAGPRGAIKLGRLVHVNIMFSQFNFERFTVRVVFNFVIVNAKKKGRNIIKAINRASFETYINVIKRRGRV